MICLPPVLVCPPAAHRGPEVALRCKCCHGETTSTSGKCGNCSSVETVCPTCGFRLSCGCGKSWPHECPNKPAELKVP